MDTPLKIVIVEDHDSLRVMMVAHLASAGYDVVGVDSGTALDEHLTQASFDILLLDLNLPNEDGLSIASRIREAYPYSYIIMLTARVSVEDRVSGYQQGADVYMSKPTSIPELEATIGSIARRHAETARLGTELCLNVTAMRLEKGSVHTDLTRQETILLKALIEAPMHFLPAWVLIERLGKSTDSKNKANLDVSITRLRKKLLAATGQEASLKVARNSGYQLTIRFRIK